MNVSLCREDAVYESGERLVARWRISRVPIDQLIGLEVSILWHTEGKGDEDLHVHHFHRLDESKIRQIGLSDSQSVSCKLPFAPLSYHGHLIHLRWCVRLRLFVAGNREMVAREIVTEQPFYLVTNRAKANLRAANDSATGSGSALGDSRPPDGKVPMPIVLKRGFIHHSRSSRLVTAMRAKKS